MLTKQRILAGLTKQSAFKAATDKLPLETLGRTLRIRSPRAAFRSDAYLRHNQRRQEHLASLGLQLADRTVLEVGGGIGDHTTFFLDRGCRVTVTDGRPANLNVLRRRFPGGSVQLLDLDDPDPGFQGLFDIVYCYGTLYHLSRPAEAIAYLAQRCGSMMLLETCVSRGDLPELNPQRELGSSPSQAVSSVGCRPTRPWVWNCLSEHFPHVYVTLTQPWHDEFPLDWSTDVTSPELTRAVFIASRQPLELPSLADRLLQTQHRS